MKAFLLKTQEEYQSVISKQADSGELCPQTDLMYMNRAVYTLLEYMIPVMNEKREAYQKLIVEVLNRMPQEGGILQ